MNQKKDTGDRGEELAARYLVQKGLQIIERNWRFKHLEIDIIALDKDSLVVAEVKTRASKEYGDPASFVTMAKQKKLIRAANFYVAEKDLNNEVRFDVVSVFELGTVVDIEHFVDAFYPVVNKNKLI